MAQLSSFATTAANVATDAATRTITISNEVVDIDGVLDPPTGFDDWGDWTIICQNSGGFRSTTGASGTLGGGATTLRIIEKGNGHRFGGDNLNGSNSRFAGNTTNVMKYHNIYWLVESGGRSDFDVSKGSNQNGSQGPKVEFSGVRLVQLGNTTNFNHYSGNASIKIHPGVGYGLSIRNETNGHAIEFSTVVQDGAVVEGLVIDDVVANNNDTLDIGGVPTKKARVGARLPSSGSLTLRNLNTPSIASVDGTSSQKLVLIDPVGIPDRGWWGDNDPASNRFGVFEIRRTVPFAFSGDDAPSTTQIRAISQSSGGSNATGTASGKTGSVVVNTQTSAHQSSTWSDINSYQFRITDLGIRKVSLTTNETIGNSPSTINATLVADVLPDGTSISSITAPTNNNPPDNLSEVIRAIKDEEISDIDDSSYPSSPLAYVDGNSIKINTTYSIDLNSGNSELIYVENDPNAFGSLHIDLKSATTMSTSNGLTTIDATGTGEVVTLFSVDEDDDVFLKDSTGQKSVIAVTNNQGAATRFAVVDTSDGDTIGSNGNISNNSTENIIINTKNLTTGYKLVSKRKGYNYYSADVDLTGGGLRTFTAPEPTRILQPNGSPSYVNSVTVPGSLTVTVSNTGTTPESKIVCGNATFSARQIFKAWEDEISSADGDKFMGLGGQQITYIESALKGNEIVLGSHTQVQRLAPRDDNPNATVRATLYHPTDEPVDDTNGDVQTIEGLDIPAVASAIITSTDFDPTESGVQSVWGKLNDIESAVESGGGGGSSAQSIWEYREPIGTYQPLSTHNNDYVLSTGDASNFPTGTPLRVDNTGGYTGPVVGTVYYARNVGAGGIQLYPSVSEANTGQLSNRIHLGGTGSATSARITKLTHSTIEYIENIPSDVWNRSGGRTITGGGFSTSDRTKLDEIQSTVNDIDIPPPAPSVRDIWDTRLTMDRTFDFSPTGITSQVLVQLSPANLSQFEGRNGTRIETIRSGGYSEIPTGTIVYSQWSSTGLFLYTDRNDAINLTGTPVVFSSGGGGIPASISFQATFTDTFGSPNSIIRETSASVNNISVPSVQSIVDGVWAEVVDGSITGELVVDAESEAGDGFVIPNEDAALIANGDPFTLTNNGGYSGISLNTTYYAYIGNGSNADKILYIYDTKNHAIVGSTGWIQPTGNGNATSVRMVFPENRPLGTAGVALHRILAGIEELDQTQDTHVEATAAIGQLVNQILGANYIESGISLKESVQILLAVLAGRSSVSNNGTTYTWHRMDADETAVIRGEATDNGRGSPTRNPT